MKRILLAILVAVSFVQFTTEDAEARRRLLRRTRYVSVQRGSAVQKTAVQKSATQESDQYRAQQKANLMASRGVMSHFGYSIGGFEGVGYGSSANCSTCVPRGRMTLTADAVAWRGRTAYRVRVWR